MQTRKIILTRGIPGSGITIKTNKTFRSLFI